MFRPPQQTPSSLAATQAALPRTVLVVTPYYPAHGGSVERVAGALINEIAAAGDSDFIWAASNCDAVPSGDGMIPIPMRTSNFLERWAGLRWPFWSPRSLRKMRGAMKTADCLWLHDTVTLGSIMAFLMARKLNKPILVTQHQSPVQTNPIKRALRNAVDRLVTHFILKRARQVTFTSDAAAEFYYRRVAFRAPVKIIPNGVDCRQFYPCLPENRNYLRARFSLRDDQPVMLFVGDFIEENGLSVIRHLAEFLPDWRFWLVGKGRISPESWFLPNIQVFGNKTSEGLAELYQSADLLLLPSKAARFPLAAQEAMACGLPVICSTEVAAAHPFAKPYLWISKIEPTPELTARAWAKKLKAARKLLPLNEAKTELSDLAQSHWEWPNIAVHYAGLLRNLAA